MLYAYKMCYFGDYFQAPAHLRTCVAAWYDLDSWIAASGILRGCRSEGVTSRF